MFQYDNEVPLFPFKKNYYIITQNIFKTQSQTLLLFWTPVD